ncbi:MAG: VWA domain-containing protein [Eubacteriales bacterium]|nr:VWA domain-containing protein [Eubacteriales bacterium]
MKKLRKVSVLALAVLIFASAMASTAFAGTTNRFLFQYIGGEDNMYVIMDNPNGAEAPEAGALAFTLSDIELPITEMSTTKNLPVTYFCLIDISGSIQRKQLETEKAFLQSICSLLSGDDNMVIATLEDDIRVIAPSNDKAFLGTYIDGLEVTTKDTNLYAGIVKCTEYIDQSTEYNPRRCFIVLSDGDDDRMEGYTEAEAISAIENSRIPLFAVTLLRGSHTYGMEELIKIMNSFSRISVGGKSFTPLVDGMTPELAAEEIANDMKSDLIVKLDTIPAESAAKSSDYLELKGFYFKNEGQIVQDTLNVKASALTFLSAPVSTPAPFVEEEPVQETEEPADTDDWIIWAAAGAAALAVIVLIAVLLSGKKKKSAPKKPDVQNVSGQTEALPRRDIQDPGKTQPLDQSANKRSVCFTTIASDNLRFVLQLEENRVYTMGRNQKSELVLNSADSSLSSVNSKLRLRGNILDVWDAASKNGTFVNGMKITGMGMVSMRSGQTLKAGKYEYRVTF